MVKIDMPKIHFVNTGFLRFFIAVLIVIHHNEQLKSIFGFSSFWDSYAINLFGRIPLMIFYVLSGILVTSSLLTKDDVLVNKRFYIKRFFRIMPQYYVLIIWTFFLQPYVLKQLLGERYYISMFLPNLLLYLFMLPNVALIKYPIVWGVSQTWFIGYLEQFYIFWPFLIALFKRRIILILLVIFFLKNFLIKLFINDPGVTRFINDFPLESIAVGGFLAYMLMYKKKISNFFLLKSVLIVALMAFLIFQFIPRRALFFIPLYHFIDPLINPFLVGVLLIHFILNSRLSHLFEKNVFDRLGHLSYAIYLWHVNCALFVIALLKFIKIGNNDLIFNLIFYPISFLLTMIISFLSYHFIESSGRAIGVRVLSKLHLS